MPRPSPERLALLARLLKERGYESERPARLPLAPRADGTDAPLSRDQERLWFLDQLDPGSSLYNDCVEVWIRGVELDADALARALQAVVDRHESLRTAFVAEDGLPRQRVLEGIAVPLRVLDLEGCDDPEAELAEALSEDVRTPFHLDRPPLVRATLARIRAGEHRLGLTMHHVVSDGESFGLFLDELALAYASAVRDERAALAPLPIQYGDWAAWEREAIGEQAIERGLAFWRGRLTPAPPRLELPLDRPRPERSRHRGALLAEACPEDLVRKLRAFCKAAEVTTNQALLATWVTLLHGATGAEDLLLGMPSSCRDRVELEGLIGFFVRTVPLRVDLSGDPDFRTVLARTRAAAQEACAHDHVPYDRILREVRSATGSGSSDRAPDAPLIQAWFAHMRDMIRPPAFAGATSGYRLFDGGVSRFDLSLLVDETVDGIRTYLEYDTELFERATVERTAARYRALLERCMERPETRLSELRDAAEPPARRAGARAARLAGMRGARRARARTAPTEEAP